MAALAAGASRSFSQEGRKVSEGSAAAASLLILDSGITLRLVAAGGAPTLQHARLQRLRMKEAAWQPCSPSCTRPMNTPMYRPCSQPFLKRSENAQVVASASRARPAAVESLPTCTHLAAAAGLPDHQAPPPALAPALVHQTPALGHDVRLHGDAGGPARSRVAAHPSKSNA